MTGRYIIHLMYDIVHGISSQHHRPQFETPPTNPPPTSTAILSTPKHLSRVSFKMSMSPKPPRTVQTGTLALVAANTRQSSSV